MPRPRQQLSGLGRLAGVLGAVGAIAGSAIAVGQAPAAGSLQARTAAGAALPSGPMVGFGDEQPRMFVSPYFTALHVHIARLMVSWDAALNHRSDLPRADLWVRAAEQAGVQPLIALSYSRGCYSSKGTVPHLARCALPSVSTYQRAFVALRKHYPEISTWSVWNEENHRSQPTHNNPRRAAEFYKVVRANCQGCTIVAADVLDQPRFIDWVKRFRRYAGNGPAIWGLHNYEDTNNHTNRGTRAMLRAVPGEVWLTETGGIVHFPHRPFNPKRAAVAVQYMLSLTRLSTRIKRLYVYQWTGAHFTDRFDAGITGPDGQPRPAYYVIRQYLSSHPQEMPAGATGFGGPTGPTGPAGPVGGTGAQPGGGQNTPPPPGQGSSGPTGHACPLPPLPCV
jgi:hypothetical protein